MKKFFLGIVTLLLVNSVASAGPLRDAFREWRDNRRGVVYYTPSTSNYVVINGVLYPVVEQTTCSQCQQAYLPSQTYYYVQPSCPNGQCPLKK